MVTDKRKKNVARKVSLGFLCSGLSVLFFMAPGSFAQDHPVVAPQEYERAVSPQPELVSWSSLVGSFQQRIEERTATKNVRITFLNTPFGKHRVEDLMWYTFSGDGTVMIQMHDTVRRVAISPEEFYWMGKFLLQYHLADLPEQDPDDPYSAEFWVSVRVDGNKRNVRLYNSRNDKNREIIWQYLHSFGLRLLQTTGLSDQNKPIMPICLGVTGIQELDADNDGAIDWLKLRIEFYSFKSGDFTLGFCGRTTNIFLPPGNTTQYVYINAYFIQKDDPAFPVYSKLTLDMKPGLPKGPYVMGLDLRAAGFKNYGRLRNTPDLFSKDGVPVRFSARLNQGVVLEMTRTGHDEDRSVIKFFIKEVHPDRVIIGNDTESIAVTVRDPFFLHNIECIGCILMLVKTEGSVAVFEAGWSVPNKEVIENNIRHFNEALTSDNYHGDKDRARLSLDNALACKEAIENLEDLQIRLSFIAPAE